MNTQELIKKIKKTSHLKEHGKKHDIWVNDTTGQMFTVPRHKAEVPVGTANSILKSAGLK